MSPPIPPARQVLDLDATTEALRDGVDHGWHGSAAVRVDVVGGSGRTVTVGRTLDGDRLTADALVPWFCAATPLLMLLAARLVSEGELSWDDRVARYLPKFGRGKESAAVRHVLTHSIGLRADPVELFGLSWRLAVRAICGTPAEPGWWPGREHSYLPFTCWYLLGEILRRCTGAELDPLLREHVLRPLGLAATHVGMSPLEYTGNRSRLVPVGTRQVRPGSSRHQFRLPIEGPDVCGTAGPMSTRGTLTDLTKLYTALALADGPPPGITESTWHVCVARPADAVFDHRHQIPVFMGLGVKFEGRGLGERARTFGPHCSPRTMGQRGLGSLVVYGDPDAGVTVATFFDVTEQPLVNRSRIDNTSAAVYEDLGIAHDRR